MPEKMNWRVDAHCLVLDGELTHQSLLALWQIRDSLLDSMTSVDVSGLTHVDSSGLALILQFISDAEKKGNLLEIKGITSNLETLITLYNVNTMINSHLQN